MNLIEVAKHGTDVTAAGTTLGVLAAWLPPIASLFTVVWFILRFIEMFTGKTIHQIISKRHKNES